MLTYRSFQRIAKVGDRPNVLIDNLGKTPTGNLPTAAPGVLL
jgi:hypothetical protein